MEEKNFVSGQYVYGLAGIAELFHCSKTTAVKLKNTVIAGACSQAGRKIVCDWRKALELAGINVEK